MKFPAAVAPQTFPYLDWQAPRHLATDPADQEERNLEKKEALAKEGKGQK